VIELVEITVAIGLDKLDHPVRSSNTPQRPARGRAWTDRAT
jgi:hypothetical protein